MLMSTSTSELSEGELVRGGGGVDVNVAAVGRRAVGCGGLAVISGVDANATTVGGSAADGGGVADSSGVGVTEVGGRCWWSQVSTSASPLSDGQLVMVLGWPSAVMLMLSPTALLSS